ncbi:MAG: sodium:calcium antiporter [Phaeodactylibacter sp.]|nr:sodium:calcium antiporter [Phaeodactylibacter sp.]
MGALFAYLVVIIIASALVWKGSQVLDAAAEQLSLYYGLPPVVHGAVVVAIGSSFPELSSTVLSTLLHGEFDLGLSVVVGSAIFNILVIPGLSGVFSDKPLRGDKELVFKDAQFYLISVAVLLLAFSFAVIYNPVGESRTNGIMTRPIALIPVLLYGLYIFLQHQEWADNRGKVKKADDIVAWKQWLWLLFSLLLIVVGVEALVRSALFLGEFFHTPSFVWGITVIAAVTSLPDAFVSIRLARKGEGVVSLSNVLGSNIFDLLIAVPAGILIAGSAALDFAVAIPLMGFLTLATIILFTTLRTQLVLSKWECWLLLFLYAVFIAWIVLENFGLIGYLGLDAAEG